MSLENNISNIRMRIEGACKRAGRNPEDVILIAVSKTIESETINNAVKCGINRLGENKVQEIMDKYKSVGGDVEWHMIGHLQTNKVKYIIDKVAMIQSVDSIKLLNEIDKRAKAINRNIEVLVEINIGREESKYGIYPENLADFLNEGKKYSNTIISGLMTVAPASEISESVRPYFKDMKILFDKFKSYEGLNMRYLSMGMTGDFEVAIEEGSNIVRIGTGIFGPRNYNI